MERMKMVRMQFREMKQLIRIRDIRVIRQKMIRFSRWMKLWKHLDLMNSNYAQPINVIPILCPSPVSIILNMIRRQEK